MSQRVDNLHASMEDIINADITASGSSVPQSPVPPPLPSVQPGTTILNRIPQPPAPSPSRTSTHLDMSEDDLRSWAAAAAALLPTLTSVDQNLSHSSLDDKVSGRGY